MIGVADVPFVGTSVHLSAQKIEQAGAVKQLSHEIIRDLTLWCHEIINSFTPW